MIALHELHGAQTEPTKVFPDVLLHADRLPSIARQKPFSGIAPEASRLGSSNRGQHGLPLERRQYTQQISSNEIAHRLLARTKPFF